MYDSSVTAGRGARHPKMGVTGKCLGGKGYGPECVTTELQRVEVPGTQMV